MSTYETLLHRVGKAGPGTLTTERRTETLKSQTASSDKRKAECSAQTSCIVATQRRRQQDAMVNNERPPLTSQRSFHCGASIHRSPQDPASERTAKRDKHQVMPPGVSAEPERLCTTSKVSTLVCVCKMLKATKQIAAYPSLPYVPNLQLGLWSC